MAVYEDEVDIHLDPKIGTDWMVFGPQMEVLTPGKNVKRYLANAIDSRTGEQVFVLRYPSGIRWIAINQPRSSSTGLGMASST